MSPLRYPLYAGLLVGEVRHDALEFSAAGMSLSLPVMERAGLDHLRRGEECAVTLCVGGADWQEEYEVVLRLAVRSSTLAGFAFVGLPPLARVMLERREDVAEMWDDDAFEGASAPFAFARLAEPIEDARRFILPISEMVFSLTQRRKLQAPSPHAAAEPPPARHRRTAPPPSDATPTGTALVYTVAVLALLLVVVMMAFG